MAGQNEDDPNTVESPAIDSSKPLDEQTGSLDQIADEIKAEADAKQLDEERRKAVLEVGSSDIGMENDGDDEPIPDFNEYCSNDPTELLKLIQADISFYKAFEKTFEGDKKIDPKTFLRDFRKHSKPFRARGPTSLTVVMKNFKDVGSSEFNVINPDTGESLNPRAIYRNFQIWRVALEAAEAFIEDNPEDAGLDIRAVCLEGQARNEGKIKQVLESTSIDGYIAKGMRLEGYGEPAIKATLNTVKGARPVKNSEPDSE